MNVGPSIPPVSAQPAPLSPAPTPRTVTISKIGYQILNVFSEVIHLPLRYLGSKTWSIPGACYRYVTNLAKRALGIKPEPLFPHSCYNFSGIQKATKDQVQSLLKYAAITSGSFNTDPEWFNSLGYRLADLRQYPLDPSSLPGLIQLREGAYFDPKTGFKAMIVEKEDEVVISFGCLGSGSVYTNSKFERKKLEVSQHASLIHNMTGLIPPYVTQADALVKALLEKGAFQPKKVTLTGLCLGGMIASYVGMKHHVPTFCFNSYPLGVGLQYRIRNQLQDAEQYVTHLSTKHDYVSDFPGAALIDIPLNLSGVRTPGNFGKRFSIPSAYRHPAKGHGLILGSMMKWLGYPVKTKPGEMSPKDLAACK